MPPNPPIDSRDTASIDWEAMLADGLITPDEHQRGLQAIEAGFDPVLWINGRRALLR